MKFLFFCGFFLLPLLLLAFEDPFQWDLSPREIQVSTGGEFSVELNLAIPPNHYLYKEKTTLRLLEGEGIQQGGIETSPSVRKIDPFFRKEMEIFTDSAFVRRSFSVDRSLPLGKRQIKLEVTYQGCKEDLCYREMHHEVPIELKIVASSGEPSIAPPKSMIAGKKFIGQLGLAFLGGILTDLTPCVLPIIPLTLAFIGVRREKRKRHHDFLLTALMVLSMSFTYALLGLTGALLGKSLGFLFQGVYFSIFAALLFLVFALALIGWIPFQIPLGLHQRASRLGGKGIPGAILAGMTIGLIAAPCVGPVIASLLLFVAETADLLRGFTILFAFGLGMGSLFLVLALFYETFAGKIPGAGMTLWIKRVIALLLVVTSFYYGYVAYRQIRPASVTSSYWLTEPEIVFRKAYGEKKPILVDFYAVWCLPCLEMERKTFSDPIVKEYILKNFVPLKVDCTKQTSVCKEMIDQYDVVGWPTYLLLNSEGEIQESIVGRVLGPSEFLPILEKYLSNIK
ncbi:MAG: thioredoxin family protein [Deltaproteobacteria bacterium]|nr:thioredoxin family protein [Deltaproteobacteria bacterium]